LARSSGFGVTNGPVRLGRQTRQHVALEVFALLVPRERDAVAVEQRGLAVQREHELWRARLADITAKRRNLHEAGHQSITFGVSENVILEG
jgi:hypothetical protein